MMNKDRLDLAEQTVTNGDELVWARDQECEDRQLNIWMMMMMTGDENDEKTGRHLLISLRWLRSIPGRC